MNQQQIILSGFTQEDLLSQISSIVSKCVKAELAVLKSNAGKEADQWLSIKELCEYLPDKPAIQTVYGWVSDNTIPVHKGPKKLRFLKSEIDEWLKSKKKKSAQDFAIAADTFLSDNKNKK